MTGIRELDMQHQQLFVFANALEEEIKKGATPATIKKAIGFMERYTVEHFQYEEMCMHGASCPETEMNKKAHAEFILELKRMDIKWDGGKGDQETLIQLHKFVEFWLDAHILKVDSKLKGCVAYTHDKTVKNSSVPDAIL